MLLSVGIPGDRAHRLLGASSAGPAVYGIRASVHSYQTSPEPTVQGTFAGISHQDSKPVDVIVHLPI